MLRVAAIILGIVIAAIGGVMVYRALFLEPSAAIVITNSEIREVPNYPRIVGGTVLLVGGTALAFFAARRKPM